MFRIDHPTRAAALPSPEAVATQGFFTRGNPSTSTPATVVTDDWLNATQEELANAIEGNGIALDKGSRNQLQQAMGKLAGGSVNLLLNPEGSIAQRGATRVVTNSESVTGSGPDHWWAKAGGVGDSANFTGGNSTAVSGISSARGRLRFNKGTNANTGVEPTLRQSIDDVRHFHGTKVVLAFDAFKNSGSDLAIVGVEVVQDFGNSGSPSADVTTALASLNGQTTIDGTVRRFVFGATLPSVVGKTITTRDHLKVRVRFATNQPFDVFLTAFVFSQGSVDPGYQPRQIGEDLLLCQRYYESSIDSLGFASFNRDTETGLWDTAFAGAGVVATLGRRFRVQKYESPTVTWYAHDGTANNITEGASTKHPVTSGSGANGPDPTHTGWPTITTPPASGLRDFRAYWDALAEIPD